MLTHYDEFAGVGGTSEGASCVPGVELIFAANHNKQAIASHAANFPNADHFDGDVERADITTFPRADIFTASPVCPPWSNARGERRDFDTSTQGQLFWEHTPTPETRRARALMEEVPRYLQAMQLRGRPVLAGLVENVQECRKWDEWRRWRREVNGDLYDSRLIALNSMHANAPKSKKSPQDRNRLYLAYWLKALGRAPDWNKWLRPRAYCPTCEVDVAAMQVFKNPTVDMGSYGRYGQYYYRCPNAACRNRIIEPAITPASTAIDPSVPALRIGEREAHGRDPLVPATLDRIRRGIAKYAHPLPDHLGLDIPSFGISLRGGGSKKSSRLTDSQPLGTVSASGNHHGLVPAQQLLVPYYTHGNARPVTDSIGTITTKDRWYLADLVGAMSLDQVRYRMLEPHEIGAAMAFPADYVVFGSKGDKVRQYGNAVTPPVAEVIVSALVEAITGEALAPAA